MSGVIPIAPVSHCAIRCLLIATAGLQTCFYLLDFPQCWPAVITVPQYPPAGDQLTSLVKCNEFNV